MIIVRKARKSDSASIIEFQRLMAWETEKLQLDTSVLKDGVQAVFADENKGQYFVAEENGEVVGSMLTTYEWSDWRNGVILWLQSVYVLKKARGKGIFSAMYKHIMDHVAERPGFKGIRLYVEKSNSHARKVYQSMGMIDHHYDMFEWMKND